MGAERGTAGAASIRTAVRRRETQLVATVRQGDAGCENKERALLLCVAVAAKAKAESARAATDAIRCLCRGVVGGIMRRAARDGLGKKKKKTSKGSRKVLFLPRTSEKTTRKVGKSDSEAKGDGGESADGKRGGCDCVRERRARRACVSGKKCKPPSKQGSKRGVGLPPLRSCPALTLPGMYSVSGYCFFGREHWQGALEIGSP